MFKKLKDKIEEEFKQSPLRLTASVQQIAQAISPSPSVNSLTENPNAAQSQLPDALSVSSDFFSIGEDNESGDSSKTLHNVDLTQSSPSVLPGVRSRRSSISSVASDVSSLFPIYESPLNHSYLQSEWESEIEDNIAVQLEKISKEKLYQGYKKLLYRYNKYKGRFVDLSRLHKDLQYDNIKTKNVLQESQDKALRRIAELREQCQLEQKAKAHLEESLRNDLEERDHIINTLNTKINLLRGGESEPTAVPDVQFVTTANTDITEQLRKKNRELLAEVERLQKSHESGSTAISNGLLQEALSTEHVKEKIIELKSGINRMKSDNESISNLLSKSPSTSDAGDDSGALIDFGSPEADERDKKIEKLNTLLLKCKEKIDVLNGDLRKKNFEVKEATDKANVLREELGRSKDDISKLSREVEEMKKREENIAFTIAENKMAIHNELEVKELQIKTLQKELLDAKEQAATNVTTQNELQNVIEQLKESVNEAKKENDRLSESLSALSRKSEEERDLLLKTMKDKVNEFLKSQEEKCLAAFSVVQNKVNKTEERLVKLCSERLIHGRATELELSQNITELETRLTNSGVNNVTIEDLEKEIKTLQETIIEKEKTLDESKKIIEAVNMELSEKIDRIVELGNELEETRESFTLQLASVDETLSKTIHQKEINEKTTQEIKENYQRLLSETKVIQEKNKSLKTEYDEKIKKAIEDYQSAIRQTEAASKEISRLENKLQAKEVDLQTANELKSKIVKDKEELQLKLKVAEEKVVASCDQSSETNNQLAELLKRCSDIENERDIVTSERESWKEKVVSLKSQLEDLEESKRVTTAELESSKKEIERLKLIMAEKESELISVQEIRQQEISEMKNQNEIELDSVKTLLDVITSEKGSLKETVVSLKSQLEELELNHRSELEKDKNVTKAELELTKKEIERLKGIMAEKESELSSVQEMNNQNAKELDSLKELLDVKEAELLAVKDENEKILSETKNICDEEVNKLNLLLNNEIEEREKVNINLSQQILALTNDKNALNKELTLQKALLDGRATSDALVDDLKQQICKLNEEKVAVAEELTSIKSSLEKDIQEKQQRTQNMEEQIKTLTSVQQGHLLEIEQLKLSLEEHEYKRKQSCDDVERKLNATLTECESKIESLTNEVNLAKNELVEVKKTAEEDISKTKNDSESKVVILKNEIKYLNDKFEQDVSNISQNRDLEAAELNERLLHSEKMAGELLNKLEVVAAERDELKLTCEEKSLKVSELEACLSELKTDLDRNFNETNINETEIYEGKLKKLVNDFEVEIAKRDDTIRDLEQKLFENKDAVEDLLTLREELRKLRKEIKEKDDLIDTKTEEFENLRKESENRLINTKIDCDELLQTETVKLEGEFKKQKEVMQEELEKQKTLYESNINDKDNSISNEHGTMVKSMEEKLVEERTIWSSERRDLERTSQVAIAAMESSNQSMDLLRQEIMQQANEISEMKKQHKREVLELKKLAMLRSRRASEREREGEDVEHEYLRNILYEYMMGREQMVLAKVLAAIVKFDHQQTQNILDRQSSVGQLRIL